MFSELVARNSKRSRKENGLFFASLLISIIAFYIILSLSQQDVMLFLKKMESDAVNRLLAMIPVFYGMTLVILFFLVYYASKFQLERRRHEFGIYLMFGMRRRKLFVMILAEDFRSSIVALLIGLPAAVLLSELISLITARFVGIGIIGHQFSLSLNAVLWTAVGFLLIKLTAFLILSSKMSGQEIGSLLTEAPEGTKKQMPAPVYAAALLAGVVCLGAAYSMAISGLSWLEMQKMAITLILGFIGTIIMFFGLRSGMEWIVKAGKRDRKLHVFNFRQLQENVIHQSNAMAISSILILASLCCFGAGVAITYFYGHSETHILDYTFEDSAASIREALTENHIDTDFSELFEIKVGHIRTTENKDSALDLESVKKTLSALPESNTRDSLLRELGYAGYPYLISLTGYNQLLAIAGLPALELDADEAAVYMDREFISNEGVQIMNTILANKAEAAIDGAPVHLTGTIQSVNLVTDRSITLAFALILPDDAFSYYTGGVSDTYTNGVMSSDATKGSSQMTAISELNKKLDKTGLNYESYLQNMGRQLFYVVAASYITIYLAIIFLITANTMIGVQFLMGQQKTNRRYKTMIRLGATYEILCQSANKQINWYFGIPTVVAAVSSLFGVRALFSGLLSQRTQGSLAELMMVSGAMILVLCVVECIYMTVVKRSSNRYLLSQMVPEREE